MATNDTNTTNRLNTNGSCLRSFVDHETTLSFLLANPPPDLYFFLYYLYKDRGSNNTNLSQMKKVLIAIDYTPAAEKVVATGYAIAKAMNSEIAIVHVITEAAFYAIDYSPIMGYKGAYTDGAKEVVSDIKKEADNFLAAVVQHLGDTNISTMVLEGHTTEALLKCCEDWNADLIVMGTHSHHGLDRIFGTDSAQYILKHSSIPLLAVPTE
ncbi:MAG: universal stress protein [Chitinophagaceae bacterium]